MRAEDVILEAGAVTTRIVVWQAWVVGLAVPTCKTTHIILRP